MTNVHLKIVAFSACVFFTSIAWAQETATDQQVRKSIDTSNFARVEREVDKFLKRYEPEDVLLVCDIDNTLLAMNQDLGSDQWFSWQNGMRKASPRPAGLISTDFDELLKVQGTLFALSGMHPPEPVLPEIVNRIQNEKKVTTVVLTSRGPAFRDAAERELARPGNGYQLLGSNYQLKIREARGPFLPFQLADPTRHGIPDDHKLIAKLSERLAPVTYSNGIYMTAGQHKGYMLKTLLSRAYLNDDSVDKRKFKAIVFVDDHSGHTKSMHEAFESDAVDLVTLHYMQEDGNVKNFEDSSKQHVIRDWEKLRDCLETVLVK